MVRHRTPLNDFYTFNPSPLLNRIYNYLSLFPVQLFTTILGYPNDRAIACKKDMPGGL